VKSVLVRQAGKLDNEYLTKRARQTEVQTTLQTIQSSQGTNQKSSKTSFKSKAVTPAHG